ncbi:VirB8/TrbF family protein [Escherichia coli]|uniref:VirB8/TrbF family protein n=1 Tax=Escherichia coli TaxID=562 RepID=UPI0024C3F679|nr:VirB8/TrbF family protein [Escherichia coli]
MSSQIKHSPGNPGRFKEFWNVRLTYRIEPQVEMVSGERNNNPLKFVVTSYVRDKEARG